MFSSVSDQPAYSNSARRATTDSFSFRSIGQAFYRARRLFATTLLVCWVAAALLIFITPTSYIASTQVLLEPLPRKPIAVALDGVADPLDSAQADSRMQVVKSERLLYFVAETVGWLEKAETERKTAPSGFFSNPLAWTRRLLHPDVEANEKTRALLDFMDRVGVKRLGLSYVIEISFRAKQPKIAAAMANAVTAAYLRSLVRASQLDDEVLQRRLSNVQAEEQALLDAVKRGIIPDQYFPDANARVISAAIVPLSKAAPKSLLIVAMATVAALAIGIAFSITRFQSDRTIRTGSESFIPEALRLLGTFPTASISGRSVTRGTPARPRIIETNPSQFVLAEVLAPSKAGRHRVIGLVSPHRRAGTSSVALTIADQAGRCGCRPILIDANLDTPSLSQLKTTVAKEGLTNALDADNEKKNVEPVEFEHFDFVPIGSRAKERSHIAGRLTSDILRRLSERQPVLLDLPALDESFLAPAMTKHVDGFILVAAAEQTNIDDLLHGAQYLTNRVSGFILNHSAGSKSSRTGRLLAMGLGTANRLLNAIRARNLHPRRTPSA